MAVMRVRAVRRGIFGDCSWLGGGVPGSGLQAKTGEAGVWFEAEGRG